jgi:hypothetical protein
LDIIGHGTAGRSGAQGLVDAMTMKLSLKLLSLRQLAAAGKSLYRRHCRLALPAFSHFPPQANTLARDVSWALASKTCVWHP